MELFSFRFTSFSLLLLWTFWSVTNGLGTSPGPTTEVTAGIRATTTQPTTQPATTKPPVEDVTGLSVVGRNETSVTIQFNRVPEISLYTLYNGADLLKNISAGDTNPVISTVSGLSAAQTYNMILRSRSADGRESPGVPFTASTAPENVDRFEAVAQTESSITLNWTKKSGIPQYVLEYNGMEETFSETDPGSYIVPSLSSQTLYSFTLYSVFDDIRSTGFSRTAATAPSKAKGFQKVTQNETSITLQWENENPQISYILRFNGGELNFTSSDLDKPAKYTAPGLQDTTEYTFTLITVFTNVLGGEESVVAVTAPRNVASFKAVNQNETSITLQWEPVSNNVSYILRSVHGETPITGTGNEETIINLESGTLHNFTLFAVFKSVRSSGFHLTAPTVPRDAAGFAAQTQTETTITLQWDKVGDIRDYVLEYGANRKPVSAFSEPLVTFVVPTLESGTLYSFTLYTKFENLSSRGAPLNAATVPPRVSSVQVTDRTLTTVTLQWESGRSDWKSSLEFNGVPQTLKPSAGSYSHTVHFLNAGTVYQFSVTNEFRSLKSQPYLDRTVTVINCAINWNITETAIEGVVDGVFTNATASNGTQEHGSSGSNPGIRFTGLYPGATYNLKLMYEELEQCTHPLTTIPPSLTTARCKDWNGGYSIYIEWERPRGVWDSVEVNVSGQMHTEGQNGELYAVIPNSQPAKTYQVFISSKSGKQKSRAHDFPCATDARGVIAGAFFGVLFFLILVGAVVFVVLKRPDLTSRRKKPAMSGARTSGRKSKGIPLEKFPAHFKELSADENKGLSLEYEDFALVGTEQSQKSATMPDNKPKNRFVNVLPYDRSRVKLTSSPHNDYINASFMPGYNSDREFIAAQGPMSSTVNDFWRMIWEQKARGVVMVTNCTEGGRTKCEQYWPDSRPRECGDLTVFTTSEKKESDWTLREFTVKHKRTSEERTVKHFHFTAWPDHGVPEGTEVLIQFRALVRKHIQTEAAGTPTVVHCSAGVGRTGTIIALDVLLQQLEKEKVVDINGFVHKMRLNRPHMVQTESQYVFLHQCVLDSLQPNETHEEENIYENENELFYANATALREYQHNMNKA